MHDWKKLLSVANDLAQRKGAPIRRDIPKEEVKLHNKPHDGWIILRGKVYNIGPYLPYHPGGVDIMKGVLGKDATSLFDKYHRWVNIDGLIGPLLLGTVATAKTPTPTNTKESSLPNAPRVLPVPTNQSSLGGDNNDDDDEEEEDLLPPPPPRN